MRTESEAGRIQLYGWDGRGRSWCGPTTLERRRAPARLVANLRGAPGGQWYGVMHCGATGQPQARFFLLIHHLQDCATALIYCHDSRSGPAELLTVVPARLRSNLRADFAFEFVAFARFLGALTEEDALTVHDGVKAGLKENCACDSLVFSISTGLWSEDSDHVLSHCVEKAAAGMLAWLEE